ncbi:MAG: hypothetical protein ABFD16_26600 [Thermoguttaceae bacterium]
MVLVKQAVEKAVEFVQEMYEGQALDDLRLEEVERSDDNKLWSITLSFLKPPSPLQSSLSLPRSREYKVVAVSAETGEVRSMKIRTLT